VTAKIWYADGPGSPRTSPVDALQLAGFDPAEGFDLTVGWMLERLAWLDDPALRARTIMAGYALANATKEGRITVLPGRLSMVPDRVIADQPDLGVIAAIRRGDGYCYTGSLAWADALAESAKRVVLEVHEDGFDLGAPMIEANVVAVVSRPAVLAAPTATSRPADAIDLRIGELVASLLPDRPTLQMGPGGIGEGIARAMRHPVSIWSGLITEAAAALHERGLLIGQAVGSYAWGTTAIESLATAGRLRLQPSRQTIHAHVPASIDRFVSCNTALQVGLDGSVNVEKVGGRFIASVGGHADFCEGATRSRGGVSIIAVRSTTANGTSTIVPEVEMISTPSETIQIVVTEHGIAEIVGTEPSERARRLIAIAAPEHRANLIDALG
jgi:acyl-CoA hydrolase